MISVRYKKYTALGMICLMSGFFLLLTASPIPPFASATWAQEGSTTPALLNLQKELVETLRTQMEAMKAEARIGQRNIQEIIYASEAYFRELEVQQVMEARSGKELVSEKQLLTVRIAARSKASSYF